MGVRVPPQESSRSDAPGSCSFIELVCRIEESPGVRLGNNARFSALCGLPVLAVLTDGPCVVLVAFPGSTPGQGKLWNSYRPKG